jgi:catechol 2,3-dioxygenase-like lactoylglutathione lyase family enzyme
MEQRISLITLGVADLDRACAFYQRLGWTRSVRAAAGVAFFQTGGFGFALYPLADLAADAGLSPARSGISGVALAHNVRRREEVDAVLAEAAAAGAAILKPGHEVFWGGYTGYFADPDGHLWEVAWNPGFAIHDDGSIGLPP